MGQPSSVSAAIGTARQFAKQPERLFQEQLIKPSFDAGLSRTSAENAKQLAYSLGVLGDNITKEVIAEDKRKQEQFTTEEAERMIAGKTPAELSKFDVMASLQHSDKGFDLTDNPYAISLLEKSIGGVLAQGTKDNYFSSNTGVPKSVDEAVKGYTDAMQETYKGFDSDNIKNKVAFDKGFYEGYLLNVQDVAHKAHIKINQEAQMQGLRASSVKMSNLIEASPNLDTDTFVTRMSDIIRENSLYADNSQAALDNIIPQLEQLATLSNSTEKLNALKGVAFFQDRKLGDEISFYPFFKKVATNVNKQLAQTAYDYCKNKDGTVNWGKVEDFLQQMPSDYYSAKIPQVDLPRYSGDLDNLTPAFKQILPSIGGLLSEAGYGDVAEYTSGYRDAEYNAQVGGAANSYHTKGDAVDIYLGDLSTEEQQHLKNVFKDFFTEVLYHDAGSGYHLHLAGYKGGLDNPESPASDETAAAYSPERRQEIMSVLEAKDRDARRIANQKQEEEFEAILEAAYTADTQAEAEQIINNSNLPFSKKKTILSSVQSMFKTKNQMYKNSTGKTKVSYEDSEDYFWNNYTTKGLWQDLKTLKEFEQLYTDPDVIITPQQQEKANKASRFVNDYWRWLEKQNNKETLQVANTTEKANTFKTTTNNENKQKAIKVLQKMAAEGMTQSEIEERVYAIAPKWNLDPEEILQAVIVAPDIE